MGMPGKPMTEAAQRNWDKLCIDYQREKGEFPGPRFHSTCRQSGGGVLFDSTPADMCHLPPGMNPPSGMMSSGPMMTDGGGPCHFVNHPDGGPPMLMVPPNNSNLTMSNSSGYPQPPGGGGGGGCVMMSSSMPPQMMYRSSMPSYHDPFGGGGPMPTAGQKRPHPSQLVDPWMPSSGVNECVGGFTSTLHPGMTPRGPPLPAALSSASMGPIPTAPVTTAASLSGNNNNSSGGRASSGRSGGKKRKAAGSSGRASSNTPSTIPNTAAATAATASQQQQHQQMYTKQQQQHHPGCGGPQMASMKSGYPPPVYMSDVPPSQPGMHLHRLPGGGGGYVTQSPVLPPHMLPQGAAALGHMAYPGALDGYPPSHYSVSCVCVCCTFDVFR